MQHLGQIALYPELQDEEQFVLLHVYEKAALTCGMNPDLEKLLPNLYKELRAKKLQSSDQSFPGAQMFDHLMLLAYRRLCMRCCCGGWAWRPPNARPQHLSWRFVQFSV